MGKVDNKAHSNRMGHHVARNQLRKYRKRSGLSQRDIGALLGYKKQWQVSRHERFETLPPLQIALKYQALYQVPVSAIFVGMHEAVLKVLERKLAVFEQSLVSEGAAQSARAISQKLKWLKDRRK